MSFARLQGHLSHHGSRDCKTREWVHDQEDQHEDASERRYHRGGLKGAFTTGSPVMSRASPRSISVEAVPAYRSSPVMRRVT